MPIRGVSRDWLALALALTVGLVALCLTGATERADNLFYDWASRSSVRPPPPNIIVVAIDDRSLGAIGPWPWPRRTHAQLLERLAAYRPLAVVYDVLFLEPDPDPEADRALGLALSRLPRVFAPMLFRSPGSDGRGYDPLWPIPPVRNGATIGQAMIRPDGDGLVRKLDLAIDGQRRWTHIAALAADAGQPRRGLLNSLPAYKPRPAAAPLHAVGSRLIAFDGPPGHVTTIPFVDVLRGEVPEAFFRGRYVLVGATAPGLGDQFSTPVGGENGVMSGIEIQANFLETLIAGRGIVEAPVGARIVFGLAALWLLMVGFLRLPPNSAGFLGIALMAAFAGGSAVLLFGFRVWAPPVSTLVVLALAQPLWTWRRLSGVSAYMIEELTRLADDPDLAVSSRSSARLGQDHIFNQVDLLRDTVARVRGLRRLVGAAVQSLPDPTLLVGLDGRITLANAEAAKLFSGSPVVTPADVERFFASSQPPGFTPETFEAPEHPWIGERAGDDGSVREIMHVPWTDGDGKPLGWVARFVDITALRRAEVVREEALQLLTHDMRSPQASILALVSDDAASIGVSLKARIVHYAQRTIELADGFLRLARADAGAYERQPTDVADAVIEAADDLWTLASSRGVRIVTETGEREFIVNGNRALLIRAFINLLDNAVKFSEPGGRIVCAVSEALAGDSATVICTIRNEGRGMPPEVVAKLFRRFSHTEGKVGSVDGAGLGLAFVQSVIKGHGGEIVCTSVVGEGTTFEIRLPALGLS